MQLELTFYVDDDGMHRARGDDERLATYLETDLQGSVGATTALIRRLEDATFTDDFNGNGHRVDFRENSVSIEALHDPEAPDRVLSRDEMLAYAKAWLAFISSR
ncbi:MAG: hypothetical protein AAF515_11785 [Pseudomonadota bacterium]